MLTPCTVTPSPRHREAAGTLLRVAVSPDTARSPQPWQDLPSPGRTPTLPHRLARPLLSYPSLVQRTDQQEKPSVPPKAGTAPNHAHHPRGVKHACNRTSAHRVSATCHSFPTPPPPQTGGATSTVCKKLWSLNCHPTKLPDNWAPTLLTGKLRPLPPRPSLGSSVPKATVHGPKSHVC